MAYVIWDVSDFGYAVQVRGNDGELIEDYSAGNHPNDSQVYVDPYPENKLAVRRGTLRKWAKQTAMEMAAEYGIPKQNVEQDPELLEMFQ